MIVKVRRKHIKSGVCTTTSCPVALAIKDRIPTTDVSVDDEYIVVNNIEYNAPRSVSRFINNFDEGRSVKPFNFKLEYRV